ncbi:MAG: dihydrofolate reductase [Sphingomicrobium sp.]
MSITLLLARASNGVIGKDGGLPWHISADLKRFKALTMGTVLVMGRRTFESLPGVLPGRRHIVLTRDPAWSAPGVAVARTVEQALAIAADEPVSVIGGAEIFRMFVPLADRIELTEVLADIDGDTIIEDLRSTDAWREVSSEDHPADDPPFRFVTLERG